MAARGIVPEREMEKVLKVQADFQELLTWKSRTNVAQEPLEHEQHCLGG